MCAPKMPDPPDPFETAQAQTGTNVSTATANAWLGNVNQKTPYGTQTFNQTGTKFISDANGAKSWYNPATGEYRSSAPISGYETITQPAKPSRDIVGETGSGWGKGATETVRNPLYEEGWQEVTGYTVPTFEMVTELSPEQQAILDENNITGLNMSSAAAEQSAKLRNLLNTRFSLDDAPAAGTAGNYQTLREFMASPELATQFGDAGQIMRTFGDAGEITRSYGADDFSADRQRVEDAYLARMRPDLDASRRRIEQQAADRGLQPGSVAYDRFVDQQARAENDARNVAIQAGGAEQSRLVGMDRDRAAFQNAAQGQDFQQQLGRGEFGNRAQQQLYDQLIGRATFANTATQQNADNRFRTTAANNQVIQGNNAINTQTFNEMNALRAAFLNEKYAERAQPINEITSLLSGAQVQNPQFASANMPQMPTVDLAGLINSNYEQRLAQAQAKSAGAGALLGGLAGLFKGVVATSDRRAKKNIEKIGTLKGHPLYEFEYRGKLDDGNRHIGVMAQEVEKKRPDAVRKGRDGLRKVDYGALFAAEAA